MPAGRKGGCLFRQKSAFNTIRRDLRSNGATANTELNKTTEKNDGTSCHDDATAETCDQRSVQGIESKGKGIYIR